MGYFSDFAEQQTILLAGDTEAFEKLAILLRRLEDPSCTPLKIESLTFVHSYGDTRLMALPVSKELGIRRIASRAPHFTWSHSEEGWLEAAEKIERIAYSTGHAYLDSINAEDAVVLASNGEYGEGWWQATIGQE